MHLRSNVYKLKSVNNGNGKFYLAEVKVDDIDVRRLLHTKKSHSDQLKVKLNSERWQTKPNQTKPKSHSNGIYHRAFDFLKKLVGCLYICWYAHSAHSIQRWSIIWIAKTGRITYENLCICCVCVCMCASWLIDLLLRCVCNFTITFHTWIDKRCALCWKSAKQVSNSVYYKLIRVVTFIRTFWRMLAGEKNGFFRYSRVLRQVAD